MTYFESDSEGRTGLAEEAGLLLFSPKLFLMHRCGLGRQQAVSFGGFLFWNKNNHGGLCRVRSNQGGRP